MLHSKIGCIAITKWRGGLQKVTEHLAAATARIENGRGDNVVQLSRFSHVHKEKRG